MKSSKKVLMFSFLVVFTFFIVSGNVFACSEGSTDCGGVCIPDQLMTIVSTIVTIIKIGVPIILIVMGMIDMGKAVASQKDDEIKKGQKTLISRVIAAGIVFFVVSIVQLLVNIVEGGQENTNSIWTCVKKFVG